MILDRTYTRLKKSCSPARLSLVAAALGLFLSAPALAEPPTSDAEADRRTQAKLLYDEGVKAAKLGQWERARIFHLQAWSLQKQWQIAANLGMAEVNAGKYRDAAEHLSYFLHEAPSVISEERRKIQVLIDQAKTKVGTLTIAVSPEGAEVWVDGVAVGTMSIKEEVFVEPGAHVVEARLDGYKPAQATKDLQAGGKVSVELQLAREEPKRAGGGAPLGPPGLRSVQNNGPDQTVIVAGSVLSGVATAIGIGFHIAAGVQLHERGPAKQYCTVQSECDEYNRHEFVRASFVAGAMASYITAVVLGAGTLTYALAKTPARPESSARVDLLLGPQAASAIVTVPW